MMNQSSSFINVVNFSDIIPDVEQKVHLENTTNRTFLPMIFSAKNNYDVFNDCQHREISIFYFFF
ncbi:hypothetical protein FGIG_09301 [Fasciola gigantica]|uniref:Uncharacterized protein n=1 Tax=Fasciola gigantica TaxID=46835 RepID=A0A504YNF2_FASGI|nr:hypothetical protein FGIG_09301 [Fasciola gigantica]